VPPDGRISRDIVDKVPVFWSEQEGPTTVALIFRVGWADESLPFRGFTHMVEHLALTSLGRLNYATNGSVDETKTVFIAKGTAEQVTTFLEAICSSLASLPLADRVDVERHVLEAEEASRPSGSWSSHMSLRFGAKGYGVGDYRQLGLRGLDPEGVAEWARRFFTADNAVALLTAPPSDAMRFPLPRGARVAPVPSEPLPDIPSPCRVEHALQSVGVSMLGEQRLATEVCARILSIRAQDWLRWTKGLSYAPVASYRALDSSTSHVQLVSDALPKDSQAVSDGLLQVIRELCDQGATREELSGQLERFDSERSARDWIESELFTQAVSELIGLAPGTADERRAEVAALTGEDVRNALQTAWRSAILFAPKGTGGAATTLPLYPNWSRRPPITGNPVKRRLNLPGGPPAGTVLVLGAEGLSLFEKHPQFANAPVTADRNHITVRFDGVAGTLTWHDGRRTLIGEDGHTITVRPGDWEKPEALITTIDGHVLSDRLISMDGEDVDPISSSSGCEVCSGQPARTVALYRLQGLRPTRLTGRFCRDCGQSLGRRWLNLYFMATAMVVSVPLLAVPIVGNTIALSQLFRLPTPNRPPDAVYWQPGRTVFNRPGVWFFIAVAATTTIIVALVLHLMPQPQ
jgi:zinc protease